MGWLGTDRYYYDPKTGEVTRGRLRGVWRRMGPYASEVEARQALDRARERDEEWQAEDERRAQEDAWDEEPPSA